MTTFELISVILGILILLGGIIGIYIKTIVSITAIETDTKVSLAKVEVQVVELRRDLDAKEIAILKMERNIREDFKENRQEHAVIIDKIDKLAKVLIK